MLASGKHLSSHMRSDYTTKAMVSAVVGVQACAQETQATRPRPRAPNQPLPPPQPQDRLESDGVHPTRSIALFTKACKARGFKHVGETTLLSFFQAVGIMNHHAHTCFAFHEIEADKAGAGAPATGAAQEEDAAVPSAKRAKRSADAAKTGAQAKAKAKAKREKKT